MNRPVECSFMKDMIEDYQRGITIRELKKLYLLSIPEIKKILRESGVEA